MIGGEFELDAEMMADSALSIDPGSLFATGRGALHAIVRDAVERFGVGLVMLPDYLCRSMVLAVEEAGCSYAYYNVLPNLTADVGSVARIAGASARRCLVVAVDYFGLVDLESQLAMMAQLDGAPVLVADLSHSALTFCLPRGADYAFTSLRKSLPAPDGAWILSPHASLCPRSDRQAPFVGEKIVGNEIKAHAESDGIDDAAYLTHTQLAERMLDSDHFYDYRMSDSSAAILGQVDLEVARERRRANFALLEELIAPIGLRPITPLGAGRIPLFLPVLLDERDRVRMALAGSRIFCPVHWPWPAPIFLEPPHPDSVLWRQELSLVIDQRYHEAEMYRIAEALKSAM